MSKTKPEELLAHGLHFGHKAQRVNPRAHKYIYKIENGISIIDLFKTAEELDKALDFVQKLGEENKTLLFVATKKQAKAVVNKLAKEHNVNFLTNKWVAGFLTNFDEIRKNTKKLVSMKEDKENGVWAQFPKHERFKLEKQLQRIAKNYEGVSTMDKLPDAMFLVDIKHEANAVGEAKDKNIPTVAIVDTNSDPYLVKYPIPANDDALSSIEYVVTKIMETYAKAKSKAKEV
jgi:small subunit ribosomal protein S2